MAEQGGDLSKSVEDKIKLLEEEVTALKQVSMISLNSTILIVLEQCKSGWIRIEVNWRKRSIGNSIRSTSTWLREDQKWIEPGEDTNSSKWGEQHLD